MTRLMKKKKKTNTISWNSIFEVYGFSIF